jgi:hypothetical protein
MARDLFACVLVNGNKALAMTSMRAMKFGFRLLPAAVASSLTPNSMWACAACSAGDPKNAGTYLGMTLMMSALPLLIIGGLGYWLYRRHS